ncbi:MAG: T9SS type A sorting domain-containing protein, partial [Bacteroidia bacterium]|nr:T9SS type A sorting domain-containing protein [Bacteroidia bacterium]
TDISKPLSSLSTLNIYPNPSDGFFVVNAEWNQAQPVELKVYDMNGRKMYRQQVAPATSWSESLDLRHLSRGVYLLQVNSPEGSTVRRLVIN